MTTTTRAFWIDRDYDRKYAGPPPSRFRNYLRSRQGTIREAISDSGAVGWSAEVWRTATAPIMYPGLVREAPRIVEASLGFDEADPQRLALSVDVAARAFPGTWPEDVRPGWVEDPSWAGPPFRLVEAPLRPGAPQAATIVRVRALIEAAAPPESSDLNELWQAAERTLDRLVAQANRALAPVFGALEDRW